MARHRKLTQKFAGFPMFKLATGGDTYPLTSPFTSEFVGLDGLALDLQFAADKTLTARKGPTPAFTRASTGRFVGSNGLIQSAGNNVARFDHDPVTLACKGLLIEESRTNSIADSNAFNNWTMSNSTVAASSVANPEGSLSAWKVVEDSLLSSHTVTRSFSAVSGTTYTASVWLKSAENGFALVGLTSAGGGFAGAAFISVNLSTGAVTTATGSPVGAASVAYSNGWFRVSFSLAAIATFSALIDIRLSRDGLWANRVYLGNGVNGMYCYGAQVEAGSFPTSYIPTTTASVIRSADVCSITGSAFSGFYNPLEGTMLEVFEASPNTNTTYVSASNGNITQNSIHFDNDTGNMRAVYYSGSSIVATLSLGSVGTVGAVNKIASAYSVNDFSASRNGGTVVVDSSGAVPASLSQINIGTDERSQTPVSFYSNRCIGSLRYYKKRLSNSKLQTLTV